MMTTKSILEYAIMRCGKSEEMFTNTVNKLFAKRKLTKEMYKTLYSLHRYNQNFSFGDAINRPEEFQGIHFPCFYYMQCLPTVKQKRRGKRSKRK